MEHATKGNKHSEKAALRCYLHNIKLKIMLNVYELVFGILTLILFYLFEWKKLGNETFAHWRQLSGSL